MREFGAQLATVNLPEEIQDVTEFHEAVASAGKTTRIKLCVHVRVSQPEVVEFQDAGRVPFHDAERVEVRDLMAAQGVNLDQSRNRSLLLTGGSGWPRGGGHAVTIGPRRPGFIDEPLTDRTMGDFRLSVIQRPEIAAPALRDRIRIPDILLLQRFHGRRIAAVEW